MYKEQNDILVLFPIEKENISIIYLIYIYYMFVLEVFIIVNIR